VSKPYKYHCRCGAPALVKWTSIKKSGETADVVGCTRCDQEWRVPVSGGVPIARKSSARSGQIAGRITIPQYRWGASRLG
jgi:hypothetical protein